MTEMSKIYCLRNTNTPNNELSKEITEFKGE